MVRLRRTHLFAAIVFFLLALAATPPATGGEPLVVVTRPNPHISELSTRDLAAIYLGEKTFVGGVRVHPVDYHRTVDFRGEFLHQVVKMGAGAFESHWIRSVFRMGGMPPERAVSIDAALNRVRAKDGTMAYIPASAIAPGETELAVIWRQPEAPGR